VNASIIVSVAITVIPALILVGVEIRRWWQTPRTGKHRHPKTHTTLPAASPGDYNTEFARIVWAQLGDVAETYRQIVSQLSTKEKSSWLS
jgi:hypothetical protein